MIATKRALVLAVGAAAALAVVPASTRAQTYQPGYNPGYNANNGQFQNPNSPDARFIRQAQITSEFERQAAQLGAQRAQNPQLRQMSQQILDQQVGRQQTLRNLAQAQNLPEGQPLPPYLSQELSTLDQQQGPAFDQELAKSFLRVNSHALRELQQSQPQLQDPQVQQFAQRMQQRHQQRLQQAGMIAQNVGLNQNTIGSYMNQVPGAQNTPGQYQNQFGGNSYNQQPAGPGYPR
ncbi:MAG TPA: DUF4142 domain-containing protein [Candidatus Acidoferrum sp.]|nr:DUF4142 domain-containing protein [Candidatus Acidoferrum sp.]